MAAAVRHAVTSKEVTILGPDSPCVCSARAGGSNEVGINVELFKFLSVDDKFGYQSEKGDGAGTIRAGSCLVAAEPGADICHQCRLLQEPVEFLAV